MSAKSHASQMRPRSRNLVMVHKEILNDVVSSLIQISSRLYGAMSRFLPVNTGRLGWRVEFD